jgi:menaquinone-dependent protoporphyrinogen IX oxidase
MKFSWFSAMMIFIVIKKQGEYFSKKNELIFFSHIYCIHGIVM